MRYLVTQDVNFDVRQSALFHSAAFCFENITDAYSKLQQILLRVSIEFTKENQSTILSLRERFIAFREVWTIVEYLDQIRQIILNEKEYLQPCYTEKDFDAALRLSRKFRNHKAHYSQNVSQTSRSKNANSQHGLLKWYYTNEELLSKGKMYIFFAACEPASTTRRSKRTFDLRSNIPKAYLLGQPSIQLFLGTETLKITEAVTSLTKISDELEIKFAEACSKLAPAKLTEEQREKQGLSPRLYRITVNSSNAIEKSAHLFSKPK